MTATRYLALLVLVVLVTGWSPQPLRAQSVSRVSGETLEDRLQAADGHARDADLNAYWIGYAIERRMYAGSRWGWFNHGDTVTLGELLTTRRLSGDEAVRVVAERVLRDGEEADRLVQKRIAILLKYQGGLTDVRTVTLDASASLEGVPLIWMGDVSIESSLDYLMSLDLPSRISEDWVGAVGAHDVPSRTVPWLLAMAGRTIDEDVRESAQYWSAVGLASLMDLVPPSQDLDSAKLKRSAMYALVNANDGHATPVVLSLLDSSDDPYVRRQALLQLGHLEEPGALAALRSLASRHLR